MQQIDNLSDDADQLLTMTLTDVSDVQLEFIYLPAIQRWSMNLSHPNLTLHGFNLGVGPNVLRQWRELIPFGMAILSTDGLDPVDISDFANGRITVNILTPDEVALVESEVLVPVPLVNP